MSPPSSLVALTSRSESSGSSSTAAVIGVCTGVGSVVLLFLLYRIWQCARRSPKVPLPPRKPLADPAFLIPPTPFSNHIPYQSLSASASNVDVSSVGAPPSPSVVSSNAHLAQSPSESEESEERTRGRLPSLGSSSSTFHHQRRHRSRTVSNAGSIHSIQSNTGTIRGPPHRSRINIVLPQPLAPGLQHNPPMMHTRQSSAPIPRAPSIERFSEARDNWPLPYATSSAGTSRPSSRQTRPRRAMSFQPPTPPSMTTPMLETPPRSNLPASSHSPDYGPPPLPPPKDPPANRGQRSTKPKGSGTLNV